MRACRPAIGIVGAFYLVALALLPVGTFGLFGQERDPLAGVFLVPLGLPWTLLTDGLSDGLRPWAAVGAPLLNIAILAIVCRVWANVPQSWTD